MKHPDLTVREQVPFNAEPPLSLLIQNFFVRNHRSGPKGNRSIERVGLSYDRGITRIQAKLLAEPRDAAGNTQPDDVRQIWNFRGYMNNMNNSTGLV